MDRRTLRAAVLTLSLVVSAVLAPAGWAQDFFAGKTITIVVGMNPPDQHDNDARVLARHMGRHIPGNPSFVIQNMPGGGGLKATHFLTTVAPRDGTAFGIVQRGLMMMPLLRYPDATFDPPKFTWIGSRAGETSIVVIWHKVPVRSIADTMTRETIMPSTGGGSDSSTMPAIYNETLGTRFRIVTGYTGGGDMNVSDGSILRP